MRSYVVSVKWKALDGSHDWKHLVSVNDLDQARMLGRVVVKHLDWITNARIRRHGAVIWECDKVGRTVEYAEKE